MIVSAVDSIPVCTSLGENFLLLRTERMTSRLLKQQAEVKLTRSLIFRSRRTRAWFSETGSVTLATMASSFWCFESSTPTRVYGTVCSIDTHYTGHLVPHIPQVKPPMMNVTSQDRIMEATGLLEDVCQETLHRTAVAGSR